MLLEDAGFVLDRHLPAAELGELRPQFGMPSVQRGLFQRISRANHVPKATPNGRLLTCGP